MSVVPAPAVDEDPPAAAHHGGVVAARRLPRPWVLLALSVAVAVVLVAPLCFLLIEAHGAGTSTIVNLIFRSLTASLLWNTVRLTVVVTVLCAVIGTAAAWFVERTDLPGRRVWAVLVVVPLAIPDFVVSFGWASLSTWVQGFRGAVLVMTLAVYPLVYLPVAASFRNADPGQEEVARSLGAGRLQTFWRITLGQARTAILGGCLLVALVLLAEYGAFEILGYQTFTTEIFTEFNVSFNVPTASALSLVLVAPQPARPLRRGAGAGPGPRQPLGSARAARRSAPPTGPREDAGARRLRRCSSPSRSASRSARASTGCSRRDTPISPASRCWTPRGTPRSTADSPPPLATLMALPVALLAIRHRGRAYQLLERSTYLVLAMPGLVIALAFSYFTERYADGFLYQSAPLLILAYAILFFPLALVGVRASVMQAPPGLEEVARSLGQRRLAVLWRVTLPLIGPGLAAAFCLVFLSAVTELTATLILIPTGVQTLATQFWAYQQNLAYGQAAPFALAIIVIAAVPSYVLGRFFDRLPSRASIAT